MIEKNLNLFLSIIENVNNFSKKTKDYLITPQFENYALTHSWPMHPYGFLMFSGGRERVHWKRMG